MSLEAQLNAQGVEFSYDEQHIRCINSLNYIPCTYYCRIYRCFPHIVNLAVQAVLSSITDITYAEESANSSDPWLLRHDVVALLRTLINKVLIFFILLKEKHLLIWRIDSCFRPLSSGVCRGSDAMLQDKSSTSTYS